MSNSFFRWTSLTEEFSRCNFSKIYRRVSMGLSVKGWILEIFRKKSKIGQNEDLISSIKGHLRSFWGHSWSSGSSTPLDLPNLGFYNGKLLTFNIFQMTLNDSKWPRSTIFLISLRMGCFWLYWKLTISTQPDFGLIT